MLRIAITGGIACGKTYVGRYLSFKGVAVWEADEAAHDLLQNDEKIHKKVVKHFGIKIIDGTGKINRGMLGDIVFADRDARQFLNNLMHPVINSQMQKWLEEKEKHGTLIAAAIIPLLYEARIDNKRWDAVVCVACHNNIQYDRMKQRGMSDKDIANRLASQWPIERKVELADIVLVNNGTGWDLEGQVDSMLKRINKRMKYERETTTFGTSY